MSGTPETDDGPNGHAPSVRPEYTTFHDWAGPQSLVETLPNALAAFQPIESAENTPIGELVDIEAAETVLTNSTRDGATDPLAATVPLRTVVVPVKDDGMVQVRSQGAD